MQPLRELDEDSDADEQDEQDEEIKLISFKRGGADATFIREIKENGWDQPLPPSPIKFTYLEPTAPRPPRRSSVDLRSRSHSRSKTPQIRASPAPSHASTSRASNRARSVRASSAAAADETNNISDESIKSSGSALTHTSRISLARSRQSSSSRRSAGRSSVAPPVVIADLTRDHPSLPESPSDDPLLLTGPDTYVVYHDQTPSAKNRSTSRVLKGAGAQTDASLSMLSHSTPLPAASNAATHALSHRRDSSSSMSSSASRSSLYTRMSGRQAADASAGMPNDEVGENESQRDEQANHTFTDTGNQQRLSQQSVDPPRFLPFDDTGFASDSDQDESAPVETDPSPSRTPPPPQFETENPEDMSSLSDIPHSFADDSAVQSSDEISAPVNVSVVDSSIDQDDSAIIDQSLHVDFADQSMDASAQDEQRETDAEDQEQDQTVNKSTSVADESADSSEGVRGDVTQETSKDLTGEVSEEVHDNQQPLDASITDSIKDDEVEEHSADVSTVDQSHVSHAVEHSVDDSPDVSFMDASVEETSAVHSNDDQSTDISASATHEADVDTSVAVSDALQAESTHQQSDAYDESFEASVVETSARADVSLDSGATLSADSSALSSVPSTSSEPADHSQAAVDVSQDSRDTDPFEHNLSVNSANADESMADNSQAVADDSLVDQTSVLEDESVHAQNALGLPVQTGMDSIDLDISLAPSEQAPSSAHPIALTETLAEHSSAVTWEAHPSKSTLSTYDISIEPAPDMDASVHNRDHVDVRMLKADMSVAEHPAEQADDVEKQINPRSRSGSVSSDLLALSTLSSVDMPEQDDQGDQVFRQKYQSSRDTAAACRPTLSRRLSLSTDSEHESDAEEHKDHEGDDNEEDELGDDDSAISDGASSSSGDGHDSEEDDEDEAEHKINEAEEEDADDDASSTHSQLDQDEQSASALEPVVIISSSASPSGASTSSLQSENEEEDEEDEEDEDEAAAEAEAEGYVVQVVRDSRDRSIRASEHIVIDDEPVIHTIHLRQPAPRPASPADETHPNHTLGDASHSRSRVLKLGQATSTPIVEISSLDPRAAARATAILKLFHKYVDEGWISSTEMGDATEGRMRRVVDAIQRAERQGRRLEDASELQPSLFAGEEAGADLTTLLMDAELSLAREGTADSESFLGSRATSVATVARQPQVTASPATPFLPGGFRAAPAPALAAGSKAAHMASPFTMAPSRTTMGSSACGDSSSTRTDAHLSKRKQLHSFDFPSLSSPDRPCTNTSLRPGKQARLSAALAPPTLDTLNPRIWDTKDWVRLDKYLTSGVKKIASSLLSASTSSGSARALKANAFVDALLGIDVSQVSELFLDDMSIPHESRVGEWTPVKMEHRLLALQRKYLRKVELRYGALSDSRRELCREEVRTDESMPTEELDWSLTGVNTTSSTTQGSNRGRVSFGTPYRMGAHSTPAVGLLKKATRRAAEENRTAEREQSIYPRLPRSPASTNAGVMEEGVITKASRLISRLSGSFGGLLASPRPESASQVDKGKRKATQAELESCPHTTLTRRRMDNSVDAERTAWSESREVDSSIDSLNTTRARGMRSTINASMFTNATSLLSDTMDRSAAAAKPSDRLHPPRRTHTALETGSVNHASRRNTTHALTSSLQLAGGSSGVSHTPLSLLSPATHRAAARKVHELRQSRIQRNWTSPRRQLALSDARATRAPASVLASQSGRRAQAQDHHMGVGKIADATAATLDRQ